MGRKIDVRVVNHGTTYVFQLCTRAAREWVAENLQIEGWQWMGKGRFVVDHRFADSIAAMMQEHEEGPGLRVA